MKFIALPALYAALRRIGEEDLDCEAPGHGQDSDRHDDGPGKWYVTYQCPVCLKTKCDLICTDYLKHIVLTNARYQCTCGVHMDYQTYKLSVTRRKGLK